MEPYWTAISRGDGYTEWWEYTCPACAKTFESRADPSVICPACGIQTHGRIARYSFKKVVPGKGLVQKEIRDIWEFDPTGELQKVRREESEKEVPLDDPAYVFYRRYNLV